MPTPHPKRHRPGAQAGSRVNLGKIEEKHGLTRPTLESIAAVAVGIVKAFAGSRKRESEITSGVRVVRGQGNGPFEQTPGAASTPLPEFLKRTFDAGADNGFAARGPCGVSDQPQLAVVPRASAGDAKDVIRALGAAVIIGTGLSRATTIRPVAERLFDLPLGSPCRDSQRAIVPGRSTSRLTHRRLF